MATRESVERALDHHKAAGRIRDWSAHQHGVKQLWLVSPVGGDVVDLRTIREGEAFCAALASAERAERAQVATYRDALRKALVIWPGQDPTEALTEAGLPLDLLPIGDDR